eukprot:1171856-Pleurochrysis_carterae.AAC.1
MHDPPRRANIALNPMCSRSRRKRVGAVFNQDHMRILRIVFKILRLEPIHFQLCGEKGDLRREQALISPRSRSLTNTCVARLRRLAPRAQAPLRESGES